MKCSNRPKMDDPVPDETINYFYERDHIDLTMEVMDIRRSMIKGNVKYVLDIKLEKVKSYQGTIDLTFTRSKENL